MSSDPFSLDCSLHSIDFGLLMPWPATTYLRRRRWWMMGDGVGFSSVLIQTILRLRRDDDPSLWRHLLINLHHQQLSFTHHVGVFRFNLSLCPQSRQQHNKTTMLIRNVLFIGACYTSSTTGFNTAKPIARTTSLKNSYLDSIGANGENKPPTPTNDDSTSQPPPAARVEEPPSIDLEGQIVDRQSNLSFRDNRNYQSVNDDPRPFDMESRSVPCPCT